MLAPVCDARPSAQADCCQTRHGGDGTHGSNGRTPWGFRHEILAPQRMQHSAAPEQWIGDCCLASASEAPQGCCAQPGPDALDPVTIDDHRLNGLYGRDDYLDASSSSTPDTIRQGPTPAAAWSGSRRVTLTRTNARQDKNFRPLPAPPLNVEPYRSHHNSPSFSPHSFPEWRSKNPPLPGREHVGGGVYSF